MTTSLESLFECVTTLLVKNLFLMSSLNLPSCSLMMFLRVLSLVTKEKSFACPSTHPQEEADCGMKLAFTVEEKISQSWRWQCPPISSPKKWILTCRSYPLSWTPEVPWFWQWEDPVHTQLHRGGPQTSSPLKTGSEPWGNPRALPTGHPSRRYSFLKHPGFSRDLSSNVGSASSLQDSGMEKGKNCMGKACIFIPRDAAGASPHSASLS
nr:uncharacterized protein LOC106017755 [Anas platyrhynchos]XP_038029337.1 uncharacterized protein LOC106017755 [Anas platyrhynchos]